MIAKNKLPKINLTKPAKCVYPNLGGFHLDTSSIEIVATEMFGHLERGETYKAWRFHEVIIDQIAILLANIFKKSILDGINLMDRCHLLSMLRDIEDRLKKSSSC